MFQIRSLDHVAIGVKNAEESIHWYKQVLGLETYSIKEWGDFPVFLISNDRTGIAIFENAVGNPVEMPQNRKTGLPHIAFQVSKDDFQLAQDHLNSLEVEFEFQDHFNAHSIYFRDPDDYCIELTTYEL